MYVLYSLTLEKDTVLATVERKKCGGEGKDFRSRSPEFLPDLVKMQEIKT